MEKGVITEYFKIPVNKIVVNKLNPRKDMGDIEGLRKSIVSDGLIQPLVVRKYKGNGKYELIAGERRYTAIMDAVAENELPKLYEVPVILKDATDEETQRMMIVENLMRKDLDEYEETEAFHAYLTGNDDKDAVCELAKKTSINHQYIMRRVRVMKLNPEILNLWKQGKILYGHCEQLLRLDPEIAVKYANDIANNDISVSRLKEAIERSKCYLSNAHFDKKEAGCTKCQYSTQVQTALFGTDFKAEKVMCTKPTCFIERQVNFLMDNWKEMDLGKEIGTARPVIRDNNIKYSTIYREAKEKCLECNDYVTLFYSVGDIYNRMACVGAESCYKEQYDFSSSSSEPTTKTPEEKKKQRTEKICNEFSDIFLHDNLYAKTSDATADDVRILRMVLFNQVNNYKSEAFVACLGVKGIDAYKHEKDMYNFKNSIFEMERDELLKWIAKISVEIFMHNSSIHDRKKFATQFDALLDRDFMITEGYLKKKTKDEILSLNSQFGSIINVSPEGLSKMKKTSLVDEFMKCDLVGMIPPEVAEFANSEIPEPRFYEHQKTSSSIDDEDQENFDPDETDEEDM